MMFSTKERELPEVYGALSHPEMTWADIIVGFFLSFLLNFKWLVQLPPSASDKRTLEWNNTMRGRLGGLVDMGIAALVQAHNKKSTGNELVESTMTIPRRPDLWKEWGVTTNNTTTSLGGEIPVTLYFPKSILPDHQQSNKEVFKNNGEVNARSCLELEGELDLNTIPPEVPIIVCFHGGGFTIGSEKDLSMLTLFTEILDQAQEGGKQAKAIAAMVDYSLAPEFPFPAAPTDATTALAFFLDHATAMSSSSSSSSPEQQQQQRPIHVFGISAGGALATVATMECLRRPNNPSSCGRRRIESCLCGVPMLAPAADSVSYYQNGHQRIAPSDWLRWCWKVYLQLPDTTEEEQEEDMAHAFQQGSNHLAWKQSQWNGSDLARLIQPDLDLPSEELQKDSAPRFLVTTNRADPLYSDGVNLQARLKEAGAKVQWFDFAGSHWAGSPLDTEKYQALVQTWGDEVFGSSAAAGTTAAS